MPTAHDPSNGQFSSGGGGSSGGGSGKKKPAASEKHLKSYDQAKQHAQNMSKQAGRIGDIALRTKDPEHHAKAVKAHDLAAQAHQHAQGLDPHKRGDASGDVAYHKASAERHVEHHNRAQAAKREPHKTSLAAQLSKLVDRIERLERVL